MTLKQWGADTSYGAEGNSQQIQELINHTEIVHSTQKRKQTTAVST